MALWGTDPAKDFMRDPFGQLRAKWSEVPAGLSQRVTSRELLSWDTDRLVEWWKAQREEATTGDGWSVRGWYHLLYRTSFAGERLMDVGSGLSVSGITFAENGTAVTFVDIVRDNLLVLQRVCEGIGLRNVDFCYLDSLAALETLPIDYSVIFACGSLINAPFDFTQAEVQALLKHLPVGGRWIELAYPKERWAREGEMDFRDWGSKTDGGAPWMEWKDLEKLRRLFAPATFDVILAMNFHDDDFNWFDLVRRT